MSPRVSVLIPCYNAGRFLKDAVDSVLAQTYQDFEIIVADDGSTDDTATVAATLPRIRYVHHEHRGISATRNLALSHARGEFITFLDADDLWATDKLEKQVTYMDSHPDCVLVFTQAKNFFHGDENTMSQRQQQLLNGRTDQYMASSCIRHSVFEEYGNFREDYVHGEDTQWVTRLWAGGVNMKHLIDEPLYFRRVHDSNISLTHTKVERVNIMSLIADAIRQSKQKENR